MADEELDKGTDAAAKKDEAQKAWDEPETQKDDDAAEAAESDVKVTDEKDAAKDADDDEAKPADKDSDDAAGATDEKDADTKSDSDDDDDDDLDLPMDKIDALLSATSADKKSMTPQMRRVAQRQAENSKRVEETIKGTKANPSWFVPLFCFLMILGLAWAVVYYLTSKYPIPGIGAWNLLIGFIIVMVGFIMTMWWR
ncbi:cell division protein CrgA [Bifidobacterium sp. ESL0690]|uniref:cell division protein CrgA n=1 Tax=Bifidobacterium sp. ESL0690 TaxID=2983214 RepID=UPI0023F927E5|nr:cell division protein CrgA [Bifidobacterium sp. ESL0690]WEV46710.1 cell division protein CrgA [Bifidobacterium sp. ESL0690]